MRWKTGQAKHGDSQLKRLDGISRVLADLTALAAPKGASFCEAVVWVPKLQDDSFYLQPCHTVTRVEERLPTKLAKLICLSGFLLMGAFQILTPGARPGCSGENIRKRFQAMETSLHVFHTLLCTEYK